MTHTENVDPSRKRIYRIGSIAIIVFGICYFLGAVFSLVIGSAPEGEAYLTDLASHATVSYINFVLFIIAHLVLILAIVALYLLLRDNHKITMLVAVGILAVFIVLDIGITELTSLSLVSIAQNYVASSGAAQETIYAQAQGLLSILSIATLLSFVLSSIGFFFVALAMLKSPFHKITSIVGIIVGIMGTLAGFYIVVPVLGLFLVPSLFAATLWAFLVGIQLHRIGSSRIPETS
jgi:hypothetical protein